MENARIFLRLFGAVFLVSKMRLLRPSPRVSKKPSPLATMKTGIMICRKNEKNTNFSLTSYYKILYNIKDYYNFYSLAKKYFEKR